MKNDLEILREKLEILLGAYYYDNFAYGLELSISEIDKMLEEKQNKTN